MLVTSMAFEAGVAGWESAACSLCRARNICGRVSSGCCPLQGFYERAARQLVGSWRYGHCISRPLLVALLGLSTPDDAVLVARARLVLQLLHKAPARVYALFDAIWNRGGSCSAKPVKRSVVVATCTGIAVT